MLTRVPGSTYSNLSCFLLSAPKVPAKNHTNDAQKANAKKLPGEWSPHLSIDAILGDREDRQIPVMARNQWTGSGCFFHIKVVRIDGLGPTWST